MSERFYLDLRAVEQSACPKCSAPIGEWCVTKTGNRAQYLHESRVRPVLWPDREPWGGDEALRRELMGERFGRPGRERVRRTAS